MKKIIFLYLTVSVLWLSLCQAKDLKSTLSAISTTATASGNGIGSDSGSVNNNAKLTTTGAATSTATTTTAITSSGEPNQLKLVSIKPKRDAALSLSGIGYNGPSHKYLPPASLSSGSVRYISGGHYHEPQSHHHHNHHHHGNVLSSTSGYDFGNLDESNYQQQYEHIDDHHHHHQHHLTPVTYQPNKFETFIISQSEHGSNGLHGYKYVAPALSHQHHQHHVAERPHHNTYLISPVDHYQHQTTYVHNKPITSHVHGHGHESSINSGYHYAPVVEHVDHHHHQQQPQLVVPITNSLSPYLSGSLQGHVGQGGLNAGIGFSAGLGKGYQYDIPQSPYQTIVARKPQVLTSYGLPVAVTEAEDEPRHQDQAHQTTTTQHLHHHHQDHEHDVGTPAYAIGHKGLGHFTYVSSKPQAATLHTDITQVAHHHHRHHQQQEQQALIDEQQQHQHYDSHTLAEISKAPFKPSAFLGAKHEISSIASGTSGIGSDIAIYETSAGAAAVPAAQQYLPPTSLGYDYQPPTILYGAPTHSGDSAAPIYEPVEATYLPPSQGSTAAAAASSATATATAITSGSYLPPTQH